MRLYFSPGACSLAPHIVLRETGNNFDLVKVDLGSKRYDDDADFTQINSRGYVPALELDSNEVLTEGVAIMQYLADLNPAAGLVPANGTFERTRLQEMLNFLTSEVHKSFAPLFHDASAEEKQKAKQHVEQSFDYLNALLAQRSYLLGDAYSVADIYFFVLSNWSAPTGIDLSKWPNIEKLVRRVANRENVQSAMRAEGLIN